VGIVSDQAANTGGGTANTTRIDALTQFGTVKGAYAFTVPVGWDASLGPAVSVILVALDNGVANVGITVELIESIPASANVSCSNEHGTLAVIPVAIFSPGTIYTLLVDDGSPNNVHFLVNGVSNYNWSTGITDGAIMTLATFNSPANYPLASLFTFTSLGEGGSHDYGAHPR
jgi:hypothetical protein